MALLCRGGCCLPSCQWPPVVVDLFPAELVKEVRTEISTWWSVAIETAAAFPRIDGVFRGAARGAQGSYDVTSPTPSELSDSDLCVSDQAWIKSVQVQLWTIQSRLLGPELFQQCQSAPWVIVVMVSA